VFFRIFEGKVELAEAAAVEAATAICGEIKKTRSRAHSRRNRGLSARISGSSDCDDPDRFAKRGINPSRSVHRNSGLPSSPWRRLRRSLAHSHHTCDLYVLTLLFALATFSYASFTTIANVLPSDLYQKRVRGNRQRLERHGTALGTIIVFELAGHLSDARIARGDTLVRPAHGYRGPNSLCGDDSRAYAGAQYKGDRPGPGPPNLKFSAQVGCQCS
jgi:hypothetical protein